MINPKDYKKVAVVGATTNPDKYGNKIVRDLKSKGFEVYPVSPKYEEIEGLKCYKSVSDLPKDVELIVFVVPPSVGIDVLKEAHKAGFGRFWFQPDAESEEIREYLEKNGLEYSFERCIMFATSF